MTDSFDYLTRMDSPIGRIELAGSSTHLTSVAIAHGGLLPHDARPERRVAVLEWAQRQLEEYFAGTRRRLSTTGEY